MSEAFRQEIAPITATLRPKVLASLQAVARKLWMKEVDSEDEIADLLLRKAAFKMLVIDCGDQGRDLSCL